jgi:hypothetical protein
MPSISGWSEKQHSKPSTAEAFTQQNPRDNGNNPTSRSAMGGWGTSTRTFACFSISFFFLFPPLPAAAPRPAARARCRV